MWISQQWQKVFGSPAAIRNNLLHSSFLQKGAPDVSCSLYLRFAKPKFGWNVVGAKSTELLLNYCIFQALLPNSLPFRKGNIEIKVTTQSDSEETEIFHLTLTQIVWTRHTVSRSDHGGGLHGFWGLFLNAQHKARLIFPQNWQRIAGICFLVGVAPPCGNSVNSLQVTQPGCFKIEILDTYFFIWEYLHF